MSKDQCLRCDDFIEQDVICYVCYQQLKNYIYRLEKQVAELVEKLAEKRPE